MTSLLFSGMAYAILAGVPAVSGLYATFTGAVLFPFFTTWMHGSLGPFAIVGVMCRAAQEQVLNKYLEGNATLPAFLDPEDLRPDVIVSTLTFFVGLFCVSLDYT